MNDINLVFKFAEALILSLKCGDGVLVIVSDEFKVRIVLKSRENNFFSQVLLCQVKRIQYNTGIFPLSILQRINQIFYDKTRYKGRMLFSLSVIFKEA